MAAEGGEKAGKGPSNLISKGVAAVDRRWLDETISKSEGKE